MKSYPETLLPESSESNRTKIDDCHERMDIKNMGRVFQVNFRAFIEGKNDPMMQMIFKSK